MKFLLPCVLLLFSHTVCAGPAWLKVPAASDASMEKFIDTNNIRQTGPMSIFRRVWEITNHAQKNSDQGLSVKSQVEYDCMERRVRVLEESTFAAPWAQGEILNTVKPATSPDWSAIGKGTGSEAIFFLVCPYDDSDAAS